MEAYKLPIGFSMALAQRPDAMEKFCALSDAKKQEIIEGTHHITSKEDMRQYVDKLLS